ncbi:MAG: hypothetical protein ABH919_03170 [bacterium]
MEERLDRKLTEDEKNELYDSVFDSLWRDSEISSMELSESEIAGLE